MTLPTGTITFLLTDIEGSTTRWETRQSEMSVAIERHDRLIEDIVGRHSGILLKTKGEGDSTFSVFARASDAVHAAMELQLAVSSEPWPEGAELRLRAAMHTGEVDLRDGDYFGPAVNRSARLRSTAHGGQTLLTQSTSELVLGHLPKGATLASLGSHRLKDLEEPEHIYQLNHSSLPSRFPSLRSLDYMPTNLPIQVTTFVGRDREMLELKELLPTTRILTITGAGGAGKTRLAVQVAAELLDAFPNGVWFADFAPLVEARLVPYIVAGILGLRENVDETADGAPLQAPSEDITPRMIDHLRDSQVLLILDNCEHVALCLHRSGRPSHSVLPQSEHHHDLPRTPWCRRRADLADPLAGNARPRRDPFGRGTLPIRGGAAVHRAGALSKAGFHR